MAVPHVQAVRRFGVGVSATGLVASSTHVKGSKMATFTRLEVTGLLWLVARLWLGWEFLTAGWEKVFGAERTLWIGAQSGEAVRQLLGFSLQIAPGGAMAQPQHPEVTGWYAALIRHVFLPHADVMSYLVAFGEILVGIALIVGLFTRFAAAMGLLMNLSYMLAGISSLSPVMMLIEIPMVLTGTLAGYYGLDRYVLPYLQAWLTRLPRPNWTSARVAPSS
jgi:thiosulfate dehydrogenase [quinone] large subunit